MNALRVNKSSKKLLLHFVLSHLRHSSWVTDEGDDRNLTKKVKGITPDDEGTK